MNFALIGAAGYVAPRHIKAIRETGNNLVAVLDPSPSVSILDRYFPECKYFSEYETFELFLDRLRRNEMPIDYVSICSPTYLHNVHCRSAMRVGANVICERPLVLNPSTLDRLAEIEEDTEKKINVIFQLRNHKELAATKETLTDKFYHVNLKYVAPKGEWYQSSWKGDDEKSGGIATSIAIHLFDLMIWYFGKLDFCTISKRDEHRLEGVLILEKAKVTFSLSTSIDDLPNRMVPVYRLMTINDEPLQLERVDEKLHMNAYLDIINGKGLGIEDVRDLTNLLHELRTK